MENKKDNNDISLERLLNYIGLAKKAGALVAGVGLVADAVRKRKAALVFYSQDISGPSLKKLKDKTSFYNTELHGLPVGMDDLGQRIGLIRPAAAVCVTDKSFLPPILDLINKISSTGEIAKNISSTDTTQGGALINGTER